MLDLQDAARLREKLVCGEDLVLADILQVLQAQQAPCEDGCKGRKDNPNCLCGLVPAEGGYRKKGLWQKQPKRLADLGADPAAMRHQVRQQSLPVCVSQHDKCLKDHFGSSLLLSCRIQISRMA